VHFEVQNHKFLANNDFYSYSILLGCKDTPNFRIRQTFTSEFGELLLPNLAKTKEGFDTVISV